VLSSIDEQFGTLAAHRILRDIGSIASYEQPIFYIMIIITSNARLEVRCGISSALAIKPFFASALPLIGGYGTWRRRDPRGMVFIRDGSLKVDLSMSDDPAIQVLVLDDIQAIVDELITLLKLQGIAAIGARTLREAMEILEVSPSIRVVTCDVRLGAESGLDLVPRVRENAALAERSLRYLFITGDPIPVECLPASASHALLTKPVRPRVLLELVRTMLDNRH
jgi:CheY-like chemotaxis protein